MLWVRRQVNTVTFDGKHMPCHKPSYERVSTVWIGALKALLTVAYDVLNREPINPGIKSWFKLGNKTQYINSNVSSVLTLFYDAFNCVLTYTRRNKYATFWLLILFINDTIYSWKQLKYNIQKSFMVNRNSLQVTFWQWRVKLFLNILGQFIVLPFGQKMNKILPVIDEILDCKGIRRE